MPLYFLHLRDGTDELLDEEGADYETIAIMRDAVMKTVRDLMKGDLDRGVLDLRFRVDAEDSAGEIIYTLPFKHAVSIIPE